MRKEARLLERRNIVGSRAPIADAVIRRPGAGGGFPIGGRPDKCPRIVIFRTKEIITAGPIGTARNAPARRSAMAVGAAIPPPYRMTSGAVSRENGARRHYEERQTQRSRLYEIPLAHNRIPLPAPSNALSSIPKFAVSKRRICRAPGRAGKAPYPALPHESSPLTAMDADLNDPPSNKRPYPQSVHPVEADSCPQPPRALQTPDNRRHNGHLPPHQSSGP